MNYNVYIDDERIPDDYPSTFASDIIWMKSDEALKYVQDYKENTKSWILCRSFREFKDLIGKLHAWPNYISFDYDLGPNEPSGYDILKFIIECDLNSNDIITNSFFINVHSMNPVSRKNIQDLFYSYKKFKTMMIKDLT